MRRTTALVVVAIAGACSSETVEPQTENARAFAEVRQFFEETIQEMTAAARNDSVEELMSVCESALGELPDILEERTAALEDAPSRRIGDLQFDLIRDQTSAFVACAGGDLQQTATFQASADQIGAFLDSLE